MRSRALRYRLYRNAAMSCFPDGRSAPPTLSYDSPQSWTYGAAITPVSPTTTGVITSYAVTTGALPTGVSLNTSTGAITGTPTAWAPSGSFKVTATGPGGAVESSLVSWTMAFDASVFGTVEGEWDAERSTHWQDSARSVAVTADGDPVGAIDDLSANARHLIQATSTKRLTRKTGIFGSLPADRSDGIDDNLAVALGATVPQPLYVVLIGKAIGHNASIQIVCDCPTTGRAAIFFNSGGNSEPSIYAGVALLTSATPGDTSLHMFAATFNGASSDLSLDGSSVVSGITGTDSIDGFCIGSAYSLPSNFDFGHVILFSTIPSAGSKALLLAYAQARWGTP